MSKVWRWRAASRLYAAVMGRFWLPCPLCGRMFGGHEAADDGYYNDNESPMGHMVCDAPECHEKAAASSRSHLAHALQQWAKREPTPMERALWEMAGGGVVVRLDDVLPRETLEGMRNDPDRLTRAYRRHGSSRI